MKEIALRDDFAVALAECASSVCFIGIDVHCCCKGRLDTDDNVVIDGLSAVGVDCNLDNLLVRNAECSSVVGRHMDVSLCDDNAFRDFDFAARTDELAACRACNVTGFTDGSVNTEGSCVGKGKLNLRFGTSRTEDGDALDGLLGTDEGNAFFTSELAGLAQILLVGQLVTCTEKNFDVLFGEMSLFRFRRDCLRKISLFFRLFS